MAKRETIEEKYIRIIKNKICNKANLVKMTLEEFNCNFEVERVTNKQGKVSKRGKLLLQTTGETVEYESQLEKKILDLLDKSEEVIAIKTQALVFEYNYRGEHYYYPDIVFLTRLGNVGVLEVKDTISMFKMKNMKKYACLESYCKQYGWGFAMLNDKDDFQGLIRCEVNHEIESYLFNLLSTHKIISWAYMKDTCKERGYTVQDVLVACYKNNFKISSSKSRVWAFSIKK